MTTSRGVPAGQPGAPNAGQPDAGRPGPAGPASAASAASAQAGAPNQPSGHERSPGGGPAVSAAPMLPGEHGWLVIFTAAVAFLAVGVILLVWPTATLTVVAILIGIALVVTGLMRLFDGFTAKDESGGRRVADVVIGALAVIVGIYCLRHHALSIAIVAFIVGVFWLLYGIIDLAVAATARGLPGRGLRAIGGLFSVFAGLLVLFWPAITVLLVVIILGIWLIFYAAVLMVLAFSLRSGRQRATAHHAMA